MKTLLKYTLPVFAFAGLLSSCEPELEAPAASAGNADFSKYVALGNSLTAGFADNALYREGQEASYANIMAQQFRSAGGGEFTLPYVTSGESYGSPVQAAPGVFVVPPRLELGMSTPSCGGATSLGPVLSGNPVPMGAQFAPPATPTAYNNLGVPGARSFHLAFPGYGNQAGLANGTANPFFVRMATSPGTTILQEALVQQPTFFSLWIGNNDVLGYATSGGTGGLQGIGSSDITPLPVFQASIDSLTKYLTAGGAAGLIANIPAVTSLPLFTTIPYNGLVLTRQGQADSLTGAYAQAGLNLSFKVGQNPFVIVDGGAPRQMVAGELVLLTVSDSLRCKGYGSVRPIPDRFVLTAEEINNITAATVAFNGILKSAADAKGLAYADMNQYMKSITPVVYSNGVANSPAFVTGNIFSLDGVHLTPRGNAFVANEFIRVINAKYGASIPEVNPNNYPGVRFPN